MSSQARSLQEVLATVYRAAVSRLGRRRARQMELLLHELVLILPHRNLLAARHQEIRQAGAAMRAAGRSEDDLALLQRVVVAFFDAAVRQGVCDHHPVREPAARSGALPTRTLAVALSESSLAALRSAYEGDASIELEPAPTVAMEMARWYPFREIFAAYPLPSPGIEELLRAVRAEASASRRASVVVLAPADRLRHAEAYQGRGATRVLQDGDEAAINLTVRDLEVAEPRVALKVPMKVFFGPDTTSSAVLWQTENISSSGVLARSTKGATSGVEVRCELQLPGDPKQIRMEALVVRNTVEGHERVRGVGLRFLSFEGDGRSRLEAFLSSALRRS